MSDTETDEPAVTRVTSKGQVTIPKALHDRYGIDEGDEVTWDDLGTGLKLSKHSKSDGRGSLVPEDTSEDDRREVADELAEQIREKRRTDWNVETDA